MDVQLPARLTAEVELPWEQPLDHQDTAVTVRRRVRDHWAAQPRGKFFDDVLLVVTELFTNTYAHTELPRLLRLARFPEGVLVEVARAKPAPSLLDSTPRPGASRASTLLDRLCSGWGVLPEPGGSQAAWAVLAGSGR